MIEIVDITASIVNSAHTYLVTYCIHVKRGTVRIYHYSRENETRRTRQFIFRSKVEENVLRIISVAWSNLFCALV